MTGLAVCSSQHASVRHRVHGANERVVVGRCSASRSESDVHGTNAYALVGRGMLGTRSVWTITMERGLLPEMFGGAGA
jgi:hypothetical protein